MSEPKVIHEWGDEKLWWRLLQDESLSGAPFYICGRHEGRDEEPVIGGPVASEFARFAAKVEELEAAKETGYWDAKNLRAENKRLREAMKQAGKMIVADPSICASCAAYAEANIYAVTPDKP